MGTTRGDYAKVSIADGSETTVLEVTRWRGKVGRSTFKCRASLAGTLRVYFVDRDGVTAGNLETSETLAADTLTALDFDLAIPRYKVTFQRSGSDTGTCAVEVFDY
ncbi:MAG: hypothetical protein CMJ20_02520 [Phycisphaeraceae bacterium]|nr:hypothetical protein [Phycisphaeraceae bacterium]|tara:strand:- start:704 stop:1021 length:318 start_codon:yes stop_codon:yes gene_type:complete